VSRWGETTINDIASHIFNREGITVPPDANCYDIAVLLQPYRSFFLDGVLVAVDGKPIGRIGSKVFLRCILTKQKADFLQTKASDIMEPLPKGKQLRKDSPVSYVVRALAESPVAFLPITSEDGNLITAIAIRDLLPYIASLNIKAKISTISSPIVSIKGDATIKDTLYLMFARQIRRLIVKVSPSQYRAMTGESPNPYCELAMTDRDLLAYLISPEIKADLKKGDPSRFLGTRIAALSLKPAVEVDPDMTISEVAKLLMEVEQPAAVVGASIVTPYDIVVKGLQKGYY
jgi:CBS domain-containing protein